MHKGKILPFDIDRQHYTQLMAKTLPTLRAKLGLSQTQLATMIGVTRQTLSAVESGTRPLTWGGFISLLYVFTQNEDTLPLLQTLEIYTPELSAMFRVTDIGQWKGPNGQTKGDGTN